jgi:hypothetical protein
MTIGQLLKDNLLEMSKKSVEEVTLYRKWEELNDKKWTSKELNDVYFIKRNIWKPNSPEDYLKLKPVVVFADDTKKGFIWSTLRIFTHTMHWNHSPGRLLRFYMMDSVTNTYLGVISVASDFISLGGRDEWVGWSYDDRIKQKMINYTAMGSSIVPTQPIGYNYTGGKLMALLLLSDVVQKVWNERYKDTLVGVSTTSLYGGYSQYNRLKYWRKCRSTDGKIQLEPSDDVYGKVVEWMKTEHPEKYSDIRERKADTNQPASHTKVRNLQFAYSTFKIKVPENNFSRGVYFAELYDNTKEFLTRKTDKIGNKLFDNSVEALTDIWKERYAANRVKNVLENYTYNTDVLFYDDVIGLSWPETKQKYLKDVGR